MIRFRVFGLPRSGTTWVANWLTDYRTLCTHDPCEWADPAGVESWSEQFQRPVGVSCTGLWRARWDSDAPTIMLMRPIGEVQASLARLGLRQLTGLELAAWNNLGYRRLELTDLFDPDIASDVYNYLTGLYFDEARHRELVKMNVQPTMNEINRVKLAGGQACRG